MEIPDSTTDKTASLYWDDCLTCSINCVEWQWCRKGSHGTVSSWIVDETAARTPSKKLWYHLNCCFWGYIWDGNNCQVTFLADLRKIFSIHLRFCILVSLEKVFIFNIISVWYLMWLLPNDMHGVSVLQRVRLSTSKITSAGPICLFTWDLSLIIILSADGLAPNGARPTFSSKFLLLWRIPHNLPFEQMTFQNDWSDAVKSAGILTHWGWEKVDVNSQTTFSSAFPWMKTYEF